MSELITSLQNRRVKDAIKLRDRRGREKQRRIIVDGLREMRLAAGAGLRWEEVFIQNAVAAQPQVCQLVQQLFDAGGQVLHVSDNVFAKLAFGDRHEGVVGVARTPATDLANIKLPENPLVAVLSGVEKPGNVGAVLRTADAAGVSAVVLADGGTDVYNPNTIRASLGTVFRVPVATAGTPETLVWLRSHRLRIFAARVDAAALHTSADFRGPAAIVLGGEALGLNAAWQGDDVAAVKLPMHGAADSLNVSATAAVLFYEALRQRGT